jgi:hypothetical protein
MLNFTKIHPVKAEFFHAKGRTDMTLMVAFGFLRTRLKYVD